MRCRVCCFCAVTFKLDWYPLIIFLCSAVCFLKQNTIAEYKAMHCTWLYLRSPGNPRNIYKYISSPQSAGLWEDKNKIK